MKKSSNGLIIVGALAGLGCLAFPVVVGALGGLFWFSAASDAPPAIGARDEGPSDPAPLEPLEPLEPVEPVEPLEPLEPNVRYEPAEPRVDDVLEEPEVEPAASAGAREPRVRTGNVETHGSLSRDVIRRVVGRHEREVRLCYEQALARRPDLGGRVAVSFVIGADGRVTSSEIASSTLHDEEVESCIASAVRRWTFPGPAGGGAVTVNYPFVLHSAPR